MFTADIVATAFVAFVTLGGAIGSPRDDVLNAGVAAYVAAIAWMLFRFWGIIA